MIPFVPILPGAFANMADMTGALAPLLVSTLAGVFLCSVAGIVITVLLDGWQTQRSQAVKATQSARTKALLKAA
ncbi:MAG: hypothetical protein AB7G75_18935 [Candidatus Binatia bacterium]